MSFFCSVLVFHFATSATIRFIFNEHEYVSLLFPKRSSLMTILFIFAISSVLDFLSLLVVSHDDYGFHKHF